MKFRSSRSYFLASLRPAIFCVTAGVLLGTAARSEETPSQMRERSLARLHAFTNQLQVETKISDEELRAGVARNDWTEEEARKGAHWMQASITPLLKPPAIVILRLGPADETGRAVDAMQARFFPRLKVLAVYQQNIASDLLVATNQGVAGIWIAAQKPEDLQAAVRLMDETLAEFQPDALTQTAPSAATSSHPPPTNSLNPFVPRFAAIDRFKDFYAMIHPDPPFFLPNPAADPVGFRQMWRYKMALKHDSQHSFFTDPNVRLHIDDLERQYKLSAEQAWATLDKALFDSTSNGKVLTAALEHATPYEPLPAFVDVPTAPRSGYFPTNGTATPPTESAEPNYRVAAERWLDHGPPANQVRVRRRQELYGNWVALRVAMEAGSREEAAKLAEKLQAEVQRDSSDFADHLREDLKRFSLIPSQKP